MNEKEKAFFEKIFANKALLPTILIGKEAIVMDKQDWDVEQQIWQRVRANREEVPRNDLRQMQREAMELAAIYRSLAPQLNGKAREQALRLQLWLTRTALTL